MSGAKDTFKEQLQKKSLMEIENMIFDRKQKIGAEKDLLTLSRLSSELSVLQEVHGQKQRGSGRAIRQNIKTSEKPDLKSFDDYVKSKK